MQHEVELIKQLLQVTRRQAWVMATIRLKRRDLRQTPPKYGLAGSPCASG